MLQCSVNLVAGSYLKSSACGSGLRVLLGLAHSELASLTAFSSFASGLVNTERIVSEHKKLLSLIYAHYCAIEIELRNGAAIRLSIFE